jgi:FKBP-type peptidyl-prolyl cis-trans isomerase 2
LRLILLVAAVLIVSGCIGQASTSSAVSAVDTVKTGDTVSVYYTLKVDSAVFDSNVGGKLFTFQVGAGQVIPGFDKGVLGMAVGEEKTFTVLPKDGYGETGSHPLAGKTLVFTVKIVEIKK